MALKMSTIFFFFCALRFAKILNTYAATNAPTSHNNEAPLSRSRFHLADIRCIADLLRFNFFSPQKIICFRKKCFFFSQCQTNYELSAWHEVNMPNLIHSQLILIATACERNNFGDAKTHWFRNLK